MYCAFRTEQSGTGRAMSRLNVVELKMGVDDYEWTHVPHIFDLEVRCSVLRVVHVQLGIFT